MNLYHCSIDLHDDARALSFANLIGEWMKRMQAANVIGDWRLMRRKLNLASDECRDFLLEIEVDDLSQLERAFKFVKSSDDDNEKLYNQIHGMIAEAKFGLYRPFPDPENAERMGLL